MRVGFRGVAEVVCVPRGEKEEDKDAACSVQTGAAHRVVEVT